MPENGQPDSSHSPHVTWRMFWSTIFSIVAGLGAGLAWLMDIAHDYNETKRAAIDARIDATRDKSETIDQEIQERIDRSDKRHSRHNLRLMWLEKLYPPAPLDRLQQEAEAAAVTTEAPP